MERASLKASHSLTNGETFEVVSAWSFAALLWEARYMVFLSCIHFWDFLVSSSRSLLFLFIPVSSGNGREAF